MSSRCQSKAAIVRDSYTNSIPHIQKSVWMNVSPGRLALCSGVQSLQHTKVEKHCLSFKCSCLYPRTWAAPSFDQRSVYLQCAAVGGDWTRQSAGNYRLSRPTLAMYINPFLLPTNQTLWTSWRKVRNNVRVRGREGQQWNAVFWTQHGYCTHKLMTTVLACTRPN